MRTGRNRIKMPHPWAVLMAAVLVLLSSGPLLGQPRKPLLIPGKRTLYQRVVTHPGAILYPTTEAGLTTGKWVKPFSVYYVYQRLSVDEERWIEVGVSSAGRVDGWLRN